MKLKEVLIGTRNPDKTDRIRYGLSIGGIIALSLPRDIGEVDIEETGSSPQENARLKAIFYARTAGQLTLAADSALFIKVM